ncbi:MAG: symmetrical bis(5'-nucleosyl)-tetraphosphatase [Gammaproteobacteria bacterium]
MAVYAVGDVQGCYTTLLALLEKVQFDADRDHLWCTGDLVNRGPDSLSVLRFVKALGRRAVSVLGNHDLHLLAVANGIRTPRRSDTLQAVLDASDRDVLMDWLRARPLLHRDPAHRLVLIHAGLPPQWDIALACRCAAEVEAVLRGDDYVNFLRLMYGNTPELWSPDLQGWDRLRFITNCLTRLRFCDPAGTIALDNKGPPGTQAAGYGPWFETPQRRSRGTSIVFGHWSTLRLTGAEIERYHVYPLDSGCCWGGELTAMRIEDRQFFSVKANARPSVRG